MQSISRSGINLELCQRAIGQKSHLKLAHQINSIIIPVHGKQ